MGTVGRLLPNFTSGFKMTHLRAMRMICLILLASILNLEAAPRTFIHPGGINSKAELDFVRDRIRAGAQPWKDELDRLKSSVDAVRGEHALRQVDSRGPDADVSRDDATAAYAQSLLWYFTGDEIFAKRALSILNAWSDFEGFTAGTDQDCLQAGWVGTLFASAAEIMRGHARWSVQEVEKFQNMFRRAFYPSLMTASQWNGNVDLTQINALAAIAVFNDDSAAFHAALDRLKSRSIAYFYLESDGAPPAISGDGGDPKRFWSYPNRWPSGLTQETCRDNGHHTQFAIGSALHTAEIAWHQGVDVYAIHRDRYIAAMELLAGQLRSGSMKGVSNHDSPTSSRFDAWEIGYHHYHHRMGIPLPETGKLITEQIRPRAPRAVCNLAFDMLTHADLPRDLH